MDVNDAIVVGAGPAGASTALLLARAGASVTLVERARFPRRKPCGEYLSAGAVAALDALGIGEQVRGLARPLDGVRLVTPWTAPVELRFPRPALALGRDRLDAAILEAALAAGARVVYDRVLDVGREDGRVRGVRTAEHGELRGRFVVGADGIGSIVARKLGLVHPLPARARYAIGGHYGGLRGLNGFVEMYAGAGAYFAVNPLNDEVANVMVVVRKSSLAAWSGAVDEGMRGKAAELGGSHRDFAAAERIGPRVSIGPLAHRVRAVTAPGALLAGDAAGFLNPFTGQGVDLALHCGERAAATILRVLRAPGTESESTAEYARALRGEFVSRARLSALVDLLVDVPYLARRAAKRLESSPTLASVLLEALSGVASPHAALRPSVLRRLLV
ncbi:MAG: NAD(P)/FAD-dependent oxidoreductase [Candidatus Eremiobacteraeota bacterium]|nr:NAD(P)/FAD-dependent oxidoreductase [Candidatus Eremiobacteraeota bacterium]